MSIHNALNAYDSKVCDRLCTMERYYRNGSANVYYLKHQKYMRHMLAAIAHFGQLPNHIFGQLTLQNNALEILFD